MSQSIGKTIRKLRKERNLTQEELAEQLTVTSQAVSKWENETGMPDISQIVPLASVFGVSTDVLFGMFGTNNDKEVEEIIEKANELSKKANVSAFESRLYKHNTLEDALKIYPNNMKLLDQALSNGVCLIKCCLCGNDDRKAMVDGIKNECIRIGNIILNYCTDISTILRTRSWLASLYINTGDYERAKEQTGYLPKDLWSLRGPKLARIEHEAGELDNEIATRCNTVYTLLRGIENEVSWLGHAYRDKGQLQEAYESYRTFYEVIDIICKNEHGHLTSFFIDSTYHEDLAEWSIALGKTDEALDWLEKMVEYKTAIAKNWQNGIEFNTPLMSSVIRVMYQDAYDAKRDFGFLKSKAFDPIRDIDRFQALLEKAAALPDIS